MTTRLSARHPLAPAAAVLLAVLATVPAAVADDGDDLVQTIDPDQAQGTGRVVLDRGHADFGPTLNTGEWIVEIHDDTVSPSSWRLPADVVLRVDDDAILSVPDSDAYAFLGQEPGTEVWVVPQTQKPGVIWAGWNTQEPTVLENLSLGTTLSVLGVQGPGDVVVYLQSGNLDGPQPLWSSLEPFPQQSWIEVNTHTHANWVFTEPGAYLVEIQFAADLTTGESVTARDTLRFAVGDETDAEEVFEAVFDETTLNDETPSTAPGSHADGGTAEDGDATLSIVVWIVVGAITLALIGAIVIAMLASRRARSRALAARRRKEAGE